MNNYSEVLSNLTNVIKSAVEEVRALDIVLTELKEKSDEINNYNSDVDLFGIGYAIFKWCKTNDKYFSENLLKACLNEYSCRYGMIDGNFGEDVLRIYKKNLNLPQYRGLYFQ